MRQFSGPSRHVQRPVSMMRNMLQSSPHHRVYAVTYIGLHGQETNYGAHWTDFEDAKNVALHVFMNAYPDEVRVVDNATGEVVWQHENVREHWVPQSPTRCEMCAKLVDVGPFCSDDCRERDRNNQELFAQSLFDAGSDVVNGPSVVDGYAETKTRAVRSKAGGPWRGEVAITPGGPDIWDEVDDEAEYDTAEKCIRALSIWLDSCDVDGYPSRLTPEGRL